MHIINYSLGKKSILLFILFIAFIGGASYIGYRLVNSVRDFKNSVSLIQQELKSKGDYIQPFFGGSHAEIRAFMITSLSNQINYPYTLVLGDSIIEQLFLDKKFLNGGIGGAGIDIAYRFLERQSSIFWPRGPERIILAIGVNDSAGVDASSAFPGGLNSEYFSKWQTKLIATIQKAKLITKDVYIFTIIPVEHEGMFGDTYFNQRAIERLNQFIKEVAKSEKIELLDTATIFSSPQQKYSIDGVHLTHLDLRCSESI